tara:strand:- start:15188 stop:16753 length:1566 start_codon:yes stop_codon:yes gene_type:complete
MFMHENDLTKQEIKDRASRGALSIFTRHAVVRGLAFLGTLVLARLVSPESFGLFAICQFTLTLASALCIGGIGSALVRRKEVVDGQDLRTALLMQQILVLTSVISVVILSPTISRAFGLGDAGVWPLRVMICVLLLLSLKSIPNIMLQRALRHDLIAVSEILEYLTYAIVAVSLAYFLDMDIWALVIAIIARQSVSVIFLYFVSHQPLAIGLSRDRVNSILKVAIPLQASILMDLSIRSVVPIFIGQQLGVAAVGIAAMSVTILDSLLLQPLTLLASVQFRVLAQAQDNLARVRQILGQCYFMGAALFLPALIFVAIIGPTALPVLLSQKWAATGELIQWLALAVAIQLISSPIAQAVKAVGLLRIAFIGSAVNFVLQATIVLTLSEKLGLSAFALAVAVGEGTATIIRLSHVHSVAHGASLLSIVPPLISALVAGTAWLVWYHFIPLSVLGLVGGMIFGGTLYALILVFLAGTEVSKYVTWAADATLLRHRTLHANTIYVAQRLKDLDLVHRLRSTPKDS